MMKALFSKPERHLICHNRALVLMKDYPKGEVSVSSDVEDNPGGELEDTLRS